MNCYVLIGGASRRMQRSKEELVVGSDTFLQRVCSAAHEVFESVYAVDRFEGAARDLPPGVELIREPQHAEQAPLFGVITALEHSAGDAWIVAVDYPLLTAELLQYLRTRFEASSKSLLLPMWNGRMQMLCAGYRSSLLPRIRERLAAGRLDLRGLAEPDETETISETELRARFDGEPLANVNTPQELEMIRGIHDRQR